MGQVIHQKSHSERGLMKGNMDKEIEGNEMSADSQVADTTRKSVEGGMTSEWTRSTRGLTAQGEEGAGLMGARATQKYMEEALARMKGMYEDYKTGHMAYSSAIHGKVCCVLWRAYGMVW